MDKLDELFEKQCNIKNDITLDMYYDIVETNEYLKKCKTNKNITDTSLYYLIKDEFPNFSQSDKIKFGTGLEKVINNIILKYTDYNDIKPKNKKGKKEKDSLFIKGNIIIYAEYKSNINLDTEKSLKTINKCIQIEEELKVKYPHCNIIMNLVNFRYLTYDDIPKLLQKKYKK